MNENINRNGLIDQKTINIHDFCYQRSKYAPDFLFRKLRISDFRDELCFPEK